jgi:hypothetical protein
LVTVKPFASVTTSVPVVTATLLAPAVAVALIDTTAVAVVADVTVSEFTVMPLPKVAVLVPCTQWVNWPVRATDRLLAPWAPVFGLTSVRTGVPLVTVKPFARVTISVPVVTVTPLAPAVAVALIETTAVAAVAELTVSELTVMPVPKVAVEVPCTQCVN